MWQSFGGLIQTNGEATYPTLSESLYGESNYYVLNFNDNISSLATLYTLLLVNNMHITVSGFTSISYNIPVRTFFVCWYVLGVLFLLNLLTASLLSSFLSFWVFQKKITHEINNVRTSEREEVKGEERANPPLGFDSNDPLGPPQRTESLDSHHSISLLQPSEMSLQTSTLDQGPPTGGLTSRRGRSQTVTLNSSDDMFHWFSVGSTVWEGESINIAQSNPGKSASLFTLRPYFILSESKQHQTAQVTVTGDFDDFKHDLSTLAALPPQLREPKHLLITNHIPFSTHSDIVANAFEDGVDLDRDDESRSLSDESFRGETTLRLSTKFIDSRRDQILDGEENPRKAYMPSEARHLFASTPADHHAEIPPKQRTLARQWKVESLSCLLFK